MQLYEQFPILQKVSLFEAASVEHINRSFGEQDYALCEFSDGETVYSSNTENLRVGVLISGEAEIHTQSGGAHVLLKTAKSGELFGIANLYADDTAFPTLIRAKGELQVLFFTGEAFRRFIETDANVLSLYLGFLSKKIVYLNRKIATFTAGSAEHRLALFLLENQTDGKFTPPYSMTTLANLLGLGRASLYRAMERLSELSLLEYRDGCFHITSTDALSAFSNHTSI